MADIAAGSLSLESTLGKLHWTGTFEDSGIGVSVRFARDRAGVVYELVAPLPGASPVARALAERSNLLHHIAYRTMSLSQSAAHLRSQRAVPVGSAKPAVAFDGALVQFFLLPLGFLIEIIEADRVNHIFE